VSALLGRQSILASLPNPSEKEHAMHSLIQIDLARTLAHEKPRRTSEWQRHPEADRVQLLRFRLRRRNRFRFRLLFPQRSGARPALVRQGSNQGMSHLC
jgi:hypothetical protein